MTFISSFALFSYWLWLSNQTVPPERIVILDEKRDEIRGSKIGPLYEDSVIKLICRTEGGKNLCSCLSLFFRFSSSINIFPVIHNKWYLWCSMSISSFFSSLGKHDVERCSSICPLSFHLFFYLSPSLSPSPSPSLSPSPVSCLHRSSSASSPLGQRWSCNWWYLYDDQWSLIGICYRKRDTH